MKRIGLFGGTFDPPHLGHLMIAQEALSVMELDEIWFIPVSTPPHKERTHLTSGEDRYNMVEAALVTEPQFKANDIELKREGKSYTIDTIRQLTKEFPKYEFFFLIGGDMVETLDNWYRIAELKQLVTFVAFNRPGARTEGHADLHFVEFIEVNISSSFIRDRILTGKPIRYLVPREVESLIKERGLYVDDNR